ncbi:MAG: MerR family transcriptional regulator [Dehalococcoidia bacterium]|nr:MerR family transcriptional regulator [Dehalococcoidia bacterium]
MTLPMAATRRQTRSLVVPAPEAAEPLYTISVVARLVLLTPQNIRACDGAGLVSPTRSTGRQRLYSQHEVERLRRVKTLMVDMGINMAGVEVALRLMDRVAELERELETVRHTARSD